MPSQRQFNLELAVLLPLLWGFVALVLACIIPPAHMGHQLAPLLQHHADPDAAKSALILTAHPDDEAMFFAPTIRALVKGGWEVRGLCLSNGNSEGLGTERERELRDAYEVLGVEGDKVEVLNLPELQDGMTTHWDPAVIQKVVDEYLARHPVDMVVTFDPHGVSSHPNHRALSTYRPSSSSSSKSPSSSSSPAAVRLYHLRTPLALVTKYTGPLNPLARRIWHQISVGLNEWADVFDMPVGVGEDASLISGGLDYVRSVRAMLKHKTQMRWFRYGWVLGSGVMWSNDLKRVE